MKRDSIPLYVLFNWSSSSALVQLVKYICRYTYTTFFLKLGRWSFRCSPPCTPRNYACQRCYHDSTVIFFTSVCFPAHRPAIILVSQDSGRWLNFPSSGVHITFALFQTGGGTSLLDMLMKQLLCLCTLWSILTSPGGNSSTRASSIPSLPFQPVRLMPLIYKSPSQLQYFSLFV